MYRNKYPFHRSDTKCPLQIRYVGMHLPPEIHSKVPTTLQDFLKLLIAIEDKRRLPSVPIAIVNSFSIH
jgi:hypothetical protein